MYVCICNAVTERQIRQAVAEGAGSMRELQLRLKVAATCGTCAPCARDCLRECLTGRQPLHANVVQHPASRRKAS